MSWQTYVDDHLMILSSGNYLSGGAIMGQDGNIWAQSASFPQLKNTEFQSLMSGFADVGNIASSGLFIGGSKYMVVQGEPGEVIRGKKGAGGICVKKTHTALVVGIYEEPAQPGEVNVAVEKLGDYLMDNGM